MRLPPGIDPALDPAVSWIADTLDYQPLRPAAVSRAAARQAGLGADSAASRRWWNGHSLLKVLSTLLAGVATGAASAGMHAAIESLVDWRNGALQGLYPRSLLQAYAALLAISCGLALAATGAVLAFAPRAAGGGVTWIVAYLNGNSIQGLFTPAVLLIKWLGSAASMGACLCLGVEAPMVHIGACIASMTCRADQRLWAFLGRQRWLHLLMAGRGGEQSPADARALGAAVEAGRENADEREAVSAGAAAGIAAAFGALIGGVLFALEEACSEWSHRIAWRCFIACTAAVFVHAQLNPHAAKGLLSAPLAPLTPLEWVRQAPLLVAVSAGGGLLGAAFNWLRLAARPLRARPKQHARRAAEVLGVAAATASAIAALSAFVGSCLPVPSHWTQEVWVQHTCAPGEYNDLATAWLARPVWAIRTLITLGTSQEPLHKTLYYTPASLAAMAAAYLPLFAASAALAVPGGLFMPSLLLGGTAGALAGCLLRSVLPGMEIQPGLYALCSATAVLGGVFRSSISLVVLMTEATGTLAPMFGVILAVMTSNACAVLLGQKGVYESELVAEVRVNYLQQEAPRRLHSLVAEQLMSSPVVGLPLVVPVAQAQQLLRCSAHNGFPVYDPAHTDPAAGTFRLDGFILRSQLELLLAQPDAFCDLHGRYLHAPPDVEAFEESLASNMAHRLGQPSGGSRAGSGSVALAAGAEAGQGRGPSAPLLGSRASRRGLQGLGLGFPAANGALGNGQAAVAVPPSPFDNQAVVPHLNLSPFLDTAPMAVRLDTPAASVHAMFVSLSLRHIVVVNEDNFACGIITRRDLAHAAGPLLRERSIGRQPDMLLDSRLERPLDSEDGWG